MTHFQTAYHGPWRHAARPWTLLPVAHCQYAHCVKRPSTECAESHPPPLSSSRATWVFNPLSVSLHKRTTQARTPPPLSSRLISARFRSKAISAEAEGKEEKWTASDPRVDHGRLSGKVDGSRSRGRPTIHVTCREISPAIWDALRFLGRGYINWILSVEIVGLSISFCFIHLFSFR